MSDSVVTGQSKNVTVTWQIADELREKLAALPADKRAKFEEGLTRLASVCSWVLENAVALPFPMVGVAVPNSVTRTLAEPEQLIREALDLSMK